MKKDTLIAIGEALIDFIPNETGCDFENVTSFYPKVGGAPANVCGAFRVLGGKSKIITQLGDDPFGRKIEKELKTFGIDTSLVSFTDKANTALAFVSLENNGNRTFSFYRNPSADMLFDKEQITDNMFDDAYALHFCSVSLGDFPMKEAHKAAIEIAAKKDTIISFDPNLRFPLWKSNIICPKIFKFLALRNKEFHLKPTLLTSIINYVFSIVSEPFAYATWHTVTYFNAFSVSSFSTTPSF